MAYEGMIAETISINGDKGEPISAYVARPLGAGPFPGIVLIHHAPGWDEWYREATRRFAHHGYVAICPDLFGRAGSGEPDDVAARIRAQGGPVDDEVVADGAAAIAFVRGAPCSDGRGNARAECA